MMFRTCNKFHIHLDTTKVKVIQIKSKFLLWIIIYWLEGEKDMERERTLTYPSNADVIKNMNTISVISWNYLVLNQSQMRKEVITKLIQRKDKIEFTEHLPY